MSMGNEELNKLRNLFVGSVIDTVDPPDKGVLEAIAKFTVRKGARKHEFHLHATDLGWWVGEHLSSTTDPEGNEVKVYEEFGQLVDAITDHLASETLDDWDSEESALEPIADALTSRIGFRCKVTGKNWWVFVSTVSGLVAIPHIKAALTKPKGREALAEFLGIHHRLPLPEELTI